MNYIIVKNNNESAKGFGKFYARASYNGFIGTDELSERVAYSTTVTKADVKAVIEGLIVEMNRGMVEGYKIRLDNFGIFKLGITTKPADSPEDFTAAKNIVGVHVNFQPTIKVDSATGLRSDNLRKGIKLTEAPKNIY